MLKKLKVVKNKLLNKKETTMTKRELVMLNNTLDSLGSLKGVKIAYAIARNFAILKPEIEAIREANKLPKELLESENYKKFEEERLALVNAHGVKDITGKLQLDANNQATIINKDVFEKGFADLRVKYSDVASELDKHSEAVNALLEEDAKVDFYMIDLKDIPADINAQQMNGIYSLIKSDS